MEKRVEGVDKGVAGTKVYSYVYDNEDVIMEQTSATSTSSSTPSPLEGEGWGEGKMTRYVHGPGIDEPLSMTNAAGTFYYHADGLGSVVALTDSTGKVAQAYEYDAFGRLHDRMNAVKQPYTFTGREWDKETGFYYYRARYYDAETGRFTTKDPIGFAGGMNLYGYVGGNPVNRTDPMGLYDFTEFGKPIAPSQPRPWPYDPTFGPENCSAYPEGSLERSACSITGSDEDTNCVRKCLQEKYPGPNGENNFCGLSRDISDPWYWRDHPLCYYECGYPIN